MHPLIRNHFFNMANVGSISRLNLKVLSNRVLTSRSPKSVNTNHPRPENVWYVKSVNTNHPLPRGGKCLIKQLCYFLRHISRNWVPIQLLSNTSSIQIFLFVSLVFVFIFVLYLYWFEFHSSCFQTPHFTLIFSPSLSSIFIWICICIEFSSNLVAFRHIISTWFSLFLLLVFVFVLNRIPLQLLSNTSFHPDFWLPGNNFTFQGSSYQNSKWYLYWWDA